VEADVGATVVMTCDVDGNPQADIVWIYDPKDRVRVQVLYSPLFLKYYSRLSQSSHGMSKFSDPFLERDAKFCESEGNFFLFINQLTSLLSCFLSILPPLEVNSGL
jgi:hypothetical protein